MWKEIKETCFYLSFNDNNNYEILVTDYLCIWYAYLSRFELLLSLKESNAAQMRDDIMLLRAHDILSNPNETQKVDTQLKNNTLTLKLTKRFGYPFTININLVEGSKELFFQKITQQILNTVQELKDSQTELCDLLVKKDKEIEKLRETGYTHSHEQTKPFKPDTYLSTQSKVKKYFGTEQIPGSLLQKTVTPIEDTKNIKQESVKNECDNEVNIKAEPDSQIKSEVDDVTSINLNGVNEETDLTVKREVSTSSPKRSPKKRIKLNL